MYFVNPAGNKRVEIKNLTLSYAGIKQVTKQRTIYNRAEVVTIDLQAGTVTKVANPMYDKIMASMRGKSGVEYGKEWQRRWVPRRRAGPLPMQGTAAMSG